MHWGNHTVLQDTNEGAAVATLLQDNNYLDVNSHPTDGKASILPAPCFDHDRLIDLRIRYLYSLIQRNGERCSVSTLAIVD